MNVSIVLFTLQRTARAFDPCTGLEQWDRRSHGLIENDLEPIRSALRDATSGSTQCLFRVLAVRKRGHAAAQ